MNLLWDTLAVAWKELQVLARDRGALAIFLGLPLLIAGLMNAPQIASWQNEEEPQLSLGLLVVNEDEGAFGEQVVNALAGIGILQIEEVADMATADDQVAEREADAAVIIPAGFSRQIDAYEPTTVQLIVDPTQQATVSLITGVLDSVVAEVNMVGEIRYGIRAVLDKSGVLEGADAAVRQGVEAQTLGVIMTQLNERRERPAIAVRSEDMTGKTTTDLMNITVTAMMPGIAVLFAFFVSTAVISSVYGEKDQGSFRRLLAAPISRGAIVAGKMIAYMVVVFLQIGIMIVISNLLFGLPIGESPLALISLTLLLALVVTGIGLFLTAVTRTEKQAFAWAMVLSFVLGAVGGALHGIPMPLVYRSSSFLGTLSRLTPQGNAMEGYVSILAEGAGMVEIMPQLLALLVMTAVLYMVAVWRFRFE